MTGVANVSDMPNLVSALCQDSDLIQVQLSFAKDELGIRTLSGQAQGHVHMTCQRCLEPVEIELHATFNLAVAATEQQAMQLPKYYDPLIVEDDEVDLLPILEEELILSLPIVAYHEDCSIQTQFGEVVETPAEEEKPNPFSILAQLKAKDE